MDKTKTTIPPKLLPIFSSGQADDFFAWADKMEVLQWTYDYFDARFAKVILLALKRAARQWLAVQTISCHLAKQMMAALTWT